MFELNDARLSFAHIQSELGGTPAAPATPGVGGGDGTIDTAFLEQIQGLWCNLMATNGPLVPIVAGAALAVFAILFVLDEGGSYMSTILRILFGIALLVFIPSLLQTAFGINMGC